MRTNAETRKDSACADAFIMNRRISLVIHKIQTLDIDYGLFSIRHLEMSVDNVDNFVDNVGKPWGQSF